MITTTLLILCATPFSFEEPIQILANGEPIDVTTGHAAPCVYDFDGDGIRDLLVGEFGSGEFKGPVHMNVEGAHRWSNGRLRFYKNHGTDFDMQLKDWEYVKAGGEVACVPITCCVSFVPQFVDYNNDGIDDIVSASYPGDMYLFQGNGDGTYAKPEHLMNEDGEVLLAWKMIAEQYRKRAGTDRQIIHSTTMVLHDMDADGDLDIYVGSRLDGCFTIENIGTRAEPIWSKATTPLMSSDGKNIGGWTFGSNIHWVDWDQDGVEDVLIGSENGAVRWFRNSGAGNSPVFDSGVELIPNQSLDVWDKKLEVPERSSSRCKVHATDWDGDGLLDLLVGDFGTSWKHVKDLTPEEVAELEQFEIDQKKLSKRAMPLWNMDRDLTEEETLELEELDLLLNQNYKKQSALDTHSRSSHGWVWLYKQESPILAIESTPRVSITMKKSSMVQAGKPFMLSVIFDIDRGWTLGSANTNAVGIPTTLSLDLPQGFTVTQIDWPAINTRRGKAGYSGAVEVTVELEAPESLPSGEMRFGLSAQWQVCSDLSGVCERGTATLHASMQ